MARLKKYPKKPKKSASIETWRRWEERAKAVKKHNDKIKADRKAKDKIAAKYR